jgi:uncharacterized protein YjbI with pentapeptide repeats
MSELLLISSPLTAERQLDVLFVHGLGGDPIETWRSGTDENTSWPHWLSLEFGSQIGVWTLGYAAAPTKLRGLMAALFGSEDPDAGATMSLPRRAENALDRLVGAGIGQRPVCFITHSLGGLLVKSILRRAADSVSAPERMQVVEQCRGVLFLATPHHGSRLADLASAFRFYFPTVSTLDLKDNNDHLMDLYEWYRGYAPSHQILTRSFYENKETRGVVIVVPRSSADPGVTGETARGPTPLDRDHLEISKPRTRNDLAYIGSTQLIRLILDGADQLVKTEQTREICPSEIRDTDKEKEKELALPNKSTEQNDSKNSRSVLELVIDGHRTLEECLELITLINRQRDPMKRVRLVYIEEGSTHLYIVGSDDALREVRELYSSGVLDDLLTSLNPWKKITINSASIIHDTNVLNKIALIDRINVNGASEAIPFNANLSGANLCGANLSCANLSGANLCGANLSAANLFEADLRGSFLIQTDLSKTNLLGADLRGANLTGADLGKAELNRADLSGAILISANLSSTDLSGAFLCATNLINVDLRKAILTEVILIGANLSGADLGKAALNRAVLSGADLTRAYLNQTNLSQADLREANLCAARLDEADLRRANLRGAYLGGANLTQADFSEANLVFCRFGRNEGLTESHIIDMKRRGALFEDSPETGVQSLIR